MLQLDPQVFLAHCLLWEMPQTAFYLISEVFDQIEVRGLGRPRQNFNAIVLEPSFGFFHGVFRVVILLKDNVFDVEAVPVEGAEEILIKNSAVKLSI